MKKEDIQQFIKTVAIVEEAKPKKDPSIRLDDDAQDIVRVGNEWVEVTAKSNPTLGLKVIKLKDRHQACELSCGTIVTNQVIEKRLAFTPERHWRTRCQNCGKYLAPNGNGLIEGGHLIAQVYLRHFNALKGIETKGLEYKFDSKTNQEYVEIATKDGYIRKYK
jgi:hypothetical protein